MRICVPEATVRQTRQPFEDSGYTLDADLVIKALGFDPEDLPTLFDAEELPVTRWGTVRIDWRTMLTPLDGGFAVGDIVRGALLVGWASRDGRDAGIGRGTGRGRGWE